MVKCELTSLSSLKIDDSLLTIHHQLLKQILSIFSNKRLLTIVDSLLAFILLERLEVRC